MSSMRGLTTFISDIRSCTTKDAELKRIDHELANIRQNFSDKRVDGYSLKKYTWKLLYIHILGYEVNVGHMEVLRLVGGNKYSEKLCGYLAMQVLWNEGTELLKLLVQSVKKDLNPVNDSALAEYNQCLALHFLANMGGREFAESLAEDVQRLLMSGSSRSFVRKKAALTLLRMIRLDYYCINIDQQFCSYLLALLDDPNLGVVTSVTSLILGLVSISTAGFERYTVQKCIVLLAKLSFSKEKKSIYRYYLTLNPWLQVRILRLLTYFPLPTDPNLLSRLHHVLNDILTKTVITKNINKNNADYSILFEALNVIIHYASTQKANSTQLALPAGESESPTKLASPTQSDNTHLNELIQTSISLLGKFISIKECNFRYLGIETMTRFLVLDNSRAILQRHIPTIATNLYDTDISIQKRAIDLLYTLCDSTNSMDVIEKFLDLLTKCSIELKTELVLKIAILAERFFASDTDNDAASSDGTNAGSTSNDFKQYIVVLLRLIELAGSSVTEDIWFRAVQLITNSEEPVQTYAVRKCYYLLQQNTSIHETGIKVAAYIIGEFGDQVSGSEGDNPHALVPISTALVTTNGNGASKHSSDDATITTQRITGRDLFAVLQQHFAAASNPTKGLIITAYMKLANTYVELRTDVDAIFQQYSTVIDIELQQRSVEYHTILQAANTLLPTATDASSNTKLIESVFDVMPNWDITNRDNLLLKKVVKTSRMPTAGAGAAGKQQKLLEESKYASDEDESDEEEDEEGDDDSPRNHRTNASGKHVKQATIDLLGLSVGDQSDTSLATTSQALSPYAPQKLSTLPPLTNQPSGILYDSANQLQVGFKSSYAADDDSQHHTLKFILYYGNRSESDIEHLQVQVNADQVDRCIRVTIKPDASIDVIPAKKQTPHYFLIECLRPFSPYISLTLTFQHHNNEHTLPLSLPIMLSRFVTPTPMQYSVFTGVWQKYGNELVKIGTVQPPEDDMGNVTDANTYLQQLVSDRLNMALISTDSNNLIVGTGSFHTVTVMMPCLLRLETRDTDSVATPVRVTVHSGHSSVSQALLDTVVTAIGLHG